MGRSVGSQIAFKMMNQMEFMVVIFGVIVLIQAYSKHYWSRYLI